ncbi:hypothetical protein CPB83DRAFT_855338 [Crepidotus variabilis]|uniref:BTB domain-containing protein n=1 Tax=Crepidotus variabilis TaxID=179855 RepID=A0A9P6EF02_9AGAR|nr:hypothetical protein CPB83DRAFT_855338 [Crepidotus variabilis]
MVKEGQHPDRFANLVRSDFWFTDGNIVIIAGSAAFKVHRGQLERHSEVFSDLFAIPQPQDVESIEGCAFVELQDCPSDVFYFLSALYDGLYFKQPASGDFPAIAGVLRLSTKYLVEPLRQRCLARLEADWPKTLAEWDAREQRCTDANGRYTPRDHYPHPILVIELALDMYLPAILPAALYDLSRYGPSKILLGSGAPITAFQRMIGQLANPPGQTRPERPVRLSRELLCRALRGREETQRTMASFIEKELHCRAPSPECLYRLDKDRPSKLCHESFYFIMLNVLRSVGGIACGRDADPLYTLVQATEMLSRTDFSDGQKQCGLKLCQPCKTDFAATAVKAREEVWSSLPQYFGMVDADKAMAPVSN